jgi:hypothetical protein
MPPRDTFHPAVCQALIKDGWTITHDPLRLRWGQRDLYVDLGAERLLGAERGDQRIALEIKSFTSSSEMHDLEESLGQFTLYQEILAATEPDRILYLAVREETWDGVFAEPIGQLLLNNRRIRLMVFNERTEEVVRWTL